MELMVKLDEIDVPGVGLFVGAVFALLYAMTNWADNPGRLELITWGLFAASSLLFILFMWHEDRTSYPMIETRLLRWRPFLAVNIYNFICFSRN
jgi:ABC-type transport system involved in cytochrome c biogenesis permease subunit